MSVSGLEQRSTPLVIACSVWSPWGHARTTPFPCYEDCDFEADAIAPQTMRRNLSWGGFATYAQVMARISSPAAASTDSDSNEEPQSATSVMSDPLPGRARSKKQRRRKLLPDITDKKTEVVLAPLSLDSKFHGSIKSGVVPKSSQTMACEVGQSAPVTTLMIRNLPYSLTQQELLQAVDDAGCAGECDFLYLPHKFKEHKNLGFAFVNFKDAEVASKFSADWHHTYRFKMGSMHKPLNISAAAVQGRAANEKAANSHKMGRVKNNFFRPVMVESPLAAAAPICAC